MTINPTRVEAILKECLGDETNPVEGFVHTYGLSAAKVSNHRAEIIGMLEQLPTEFFDNGGGGWTALNLCQTADGDLWTGMQMVTEQLFCLAKALGLASCLMPKDMWDMFPGGMPYVSFARSKFQTIGAA